MNVKSISKTLLTRVLSFYFVLTLIVTGIQIVAEYTNTKSHINEELLTLEKTFSGSLTRAVWELNTQQIIDIAEGLISTPMIKGISIKDENKKVIVQFGQLPNSFTSTTKGSENKSLIPLSKGLFGHAFPLIFEFSGRQTKVGSVTIFSSNEVIFNRIEIGIYFLIGNAMLKTAVLMFLFSWTFSNLLTKPLTELTKQMQDFDIHDPEASRLNTINYENNELTVLENAYNQLIDELLFYQNRLISTQRSVVIANAKLDEHNLQLEQEVAKKASSLSNSMLKMEIQKQEMLLQQKQLTEENNRRQLTEETLLKTNKHLKNSIIELNNVNDNLLTIEKMVCLGSLLPELHHHIEAPISESVTSLNNINELVTQLKLHIQDTELNSDLIQDIIQNTHSSVEFSTNNLIKSSTIVNCQNQIIKNLTEDKLKPVNLNTYINEVVDTLKYKLNTFGYTIQVNCPEDIEINTYLGSLSQVIINLIMNSLKFNFGEFHNGHINLSISLKKNTVRMHYNDNGIGLDEDKLNNLFTPTTIVQEILQQSASYYVIHRIIKDNLNGSISAYSEPNEGLGFIIKFDNIS